VTVIDLPAPARMCRAYLRICDTPRSEYYGNEVAQRHCRRARLSKTAIRANTHVYLLTEIEKRP
jgi:hypothetical protein